MSEPDPIVGIDLGTTNSLVAIAGWGKDVAPRIIADERGRTMLPSVVRFNNDGSTTVGHEAREQAVLFPTTTVSSVKRLMGRSVRDAAGDLAYLAYKVVEGPNETARIELPSVAEPKPPARPVPLGGGTRSISPQEVSAIILRTLKERASRELGVEVRRAVVTVPAYFDDAQRQATRDAGRIAGLEVVRIVNEPTAAALAYGIGMSPTANAQTIVVYDLGGGTFDVSVLRVTAASGTPDWNEPSPKPASSGRGSQTFFQVLSTSGDTHLGGDDFDHALVGLFAREISERLFGGTALEFSPATRQALLRFAEAAKIRLSEHESAAVRIEVGVGKVYERTVIRAEFESLVSPLVERTIESCRRALRDAKRQIENDQIGAVVMVGGATRMPLVLRRVGETLGLTPYTALDPDLVVALGAAVQASVMMGAELSRAEGSRVDGARPPSRALLLDVVPLSLGIETVGGAMAKLVMRNTTVPTRAHERFSTSVDGQTSIKLNVLQGEREMGADCRSLGVFHLRGIPPMPAGIPKLRVEFAVDANGILSVSAAEERSGKRLDVQIVPNHGLTQEEVERMERESVTHAREDMTRHRVTDLVANAKLDIHWIAQTMARVEKAMGQGGTALVEAEYLPKYLGDLRLRISELRAIAEAAERDWQSVDADAFYKAKEELDRASVRLHEVAISLSLRQSQAD